MKETMKESQELQIANEVTVKINALCTYICILEISSLPNYLGIKISNKKMRNFTGRLVGHVSTCKYVPPGT